MSDDSIFSLLQRWSSIQGKSSKETTSSSSGSIVDLSAAAAASQANSLEPSPASRNKPRRFSHESLNDLLFWGVQLLVVAISIAIMYTKLENTAAILRTLLSEQDGELQIAKAQALKADGLAEEARQAAHKAEIQRSVAFDTAEQRMADLLAQVTQIQADVKDALEKSTQTNQLVLEAAQASKKAADESKVAAGSAATEASRAAGTAGGHVRQRAQATASS